VLPSLILACVFVERVATLSEHTNWVKGLAWDPINKFLASQVLGRQEFGRSRCPLLMHLQSADGTMIIWRVSDWSVEKRFRRPFLEKSFVSNYASKELGCSSAFVVT
jgi:protein HIRA/HIR1